jgi:GT2 family glycosyltransferase
MKISVIIPTYNRPGRLVACLESLRHQDYPVESFEVIVVDDGGDDKLEPVVQPFHDALNLKLVKQQNTGPAGARNKGVANSNAAFIAFMDDDCTPREDWLSTLLQYLQAEPSKMYGGFTLNALEGNVYSAASQSLIDFLYSYYNTDPLNARFLTSSNMAMARSQFLAVGGFDTSFPGACGEDRELCDRWFHLGHQIRFVPDALIYHRHDLALRSFWRQHFNYGTGALRYWQCKTLREQQALKTEPPAFYFGLLTYAWRNKLPRPLSISVLLVLSQFANATGYFYSRLQNR